MSLAYRARYLCSLCERYHKPGSKPFLRCQQRLEERRAIVNPAGEAEVIHACPPGNAAVTPCCGKSPLEIPRFHRVTLNPALVSCGKTSEAKGGRQA